MSAHDHALAIILGGPKGAAEEADPKDAGDDVKEGHMAMEELGKALMDKDWAKAFDAFQAACTYADTEEEAPPEDGEHKTFGM